MKLFRLLLFLMTIQAAPLSLEASLKVYRLTGNVTVKKSSGSASLQRRDILDPASILMIPAGGKVEILDSDTRRIYSSTITGQVSVKKIIEKAMDDASALTRKTNSQVLTAVRDNASAQRGRYGKSGVSRHETDAALSGLIALPDGVSYLAYLMGLAPSDQYDGRSDIILMRRDYTEGDDTFNFAVFNTLDRPLYVNVIDQNPQGGDISLYFNENPLVNPRGETLIRQYRYLLPVNDSGYIIIASEADFTVDDVKKLLECDRDSGQNFYFSLLRI